MFKVGITERGDAALDQSWRRNIDDCDMIVLITKSPHLLGVIPDNAIVHCTITGYGSSFLEPNVLPVDKTLKAYDLLVSRFGGDRIVLRVDPIISIYEHLVETSKEVISHAKGRVRVSFLDLYPHVKERFSLYDSSIKELPFHDSLDRRRKILDDLNYITNKNVEVCCEPGLDTTGCISELDFEALGISDIYESVADQSNGFKQRKDCACLGVKKELLKNRFPCRHGCLYCYWRDSSQ